jgi:hypothetical protein
LAARPEDRIERQQRIAEVHLRDERWENAFPNSEKWMCGAARRSRDCPTARRLIVTKR